MMRVAGILVVSMLAAGCAAERTRPAARASVAIEDAPAWRNTIASEDEGRLAALPAALQGLAARLPARVRTAQGALLDPQAGLDYPALPPGAYRCRTLRLRAGGRATILRTTPADFCNVSGAPDGLAYARQTGAEPAAGYFYPDGRRYIFLGARQARAGDNSIGYQHDRKRDLVGVVERVGGFRWRIAVPGTSAGAVDIVELTPVPPEQQPRG